MRTPVASYIAFATAATTGLMDGSPAPYGGRSGRRGADVRAEGPSGTLGILPEALLQTRITFLDLLAEKRRRSNGILSNVADLVFDRLHLAAQALPLALDFIPLVAEFLAGEVHLHLETASRFLE